ncbi:MAG: hypothetical protein BWK80_62025 [Desulfobacteraceae bacterium IS3]|nr:MAG: hypothetical protein BWK80_62025 [Desulfobacteraceae bacterium IS3]
MKLNFDLYKNNADNSLRFLLGTEGMRMLGICGINPSTADDQQFDMTISKVLKFTQRWGYHGFVMFNLYPLRATCPKNLPMMRDKSVVQENITHIIQIFSRIQKPTIWAAWGNTIEQRNYFSACLQEIVNALRIYKPQWMYGGELTIKKHPKHPSRLPYHSKFEQFDIDNYIKHFEKVSE